VHSVLELLAATPTPSPTPVLDPALDLGSEAWWATFWISPAVGGLAALTAAVIAYLGIRHQVKGAATVADANRTAEATKVADARTAQVDDATELRKQAIQDGIERRWWDRWQWAMDHLDDLRADLPTGQAYLEALFTEATTTSQEAMVAVAIDMLLAGR